MEENKKIPIIVGVTGYRALQEEDIPSIKNAVRKQLQKIQKMCPHSPVKMLSSLAEGGDLLCADAAEELGIALIAALPFEREKYVEDFSKPGAANLDHHLRRAEQVFVVPFTECEPGEGDLRSFSFRQAGIYVATHCHVLLALWDGGEGTKAACGTAEAVDFALHGAFTPKSGLCLRTDYAAVIHVFTPRGNHQEEPAGNTKILGNWESVQNVLHQTDDRNENAEKIPSSTGT